MVEVEAADSDMVDLDPAASDMAEPDMAAPGPADGVVGRDDAEAWRDLTPDLASDEAPDTALGWGSAASTEAVDYADLVPPPLRLDGAQRVPEDAAEDDGSAEWRDPAGSEEPAALSAAVDGAFASDRDAGSNDAPLLLSQDPDDAGDAAGDVAMPGISAAGSDAIEADAVSGRHDRGAAEAGADDFDRMPEEASVERLLAETNSQLESTEMNRRRSAIAHLKAAVAAARADKGTPDAEPPADPTGSGSALHKFREDLARVVRPRRPVDDGQPRALRRMPPLMLVSEQRVDVAEAPARSHDAIAGTVRPRRITTREVTADEALDAGAGGFADFAEAMGARDLPDMLEAAAAYTAFVEGRPSFSRPQLMQMMRAAEGAEEEFSREEQLRSFGLLLRQGRIQKLKRGQFTVADDTRFRPEQRHAGE